MKLEKYIDLNLLRDHIDNGLVNCVGHPQLPLMILSYSRDAVQNNTWDEITTKCRGLVVDDTGEIIARPFEKFFNLMTHDRPETWFENLPAEKPQVLEKLDGSLGILYRFEGYTGIASKGSFASDHAVWATTYYDAHHKSATWPLGYTPVFEMIAESVQRHVVHYGAEDHLVLTALINNETGEEAAYEDLYYWGTLNDIAVVDIYDKTVTTVISEDRSNKEGYVLNWPRPGHTPLKVKVKHDTFLALQKIAHSASPKNILQAMTEGKDDQVDEWSKETNGEIGAYVRRMANKYREMYGNVLMQSVHIVSNAEMRFKSRKEIADFFNSKQHKEFAPVAFAMLDRRSPPDVSKIVWKLVSNRAKDDRSQITVEDEE